MKNHDNIYSWDAPSMIKFFCLSKVVELPLTRAVKMACFITNFIKVLVSFTFDNNCIYSNINSLSAKVSFKFSSRFGTKFITMELEKLSTSLAPLREC
jgi:hypothetical protein